MTEVPVTTDDFSRITGSFRETGRYKDPLLFSVGGLVRTGNDTLASVRYPVVNGPGQNLGTAALLMELFDIPPEGVQNVALSSEDLLHILVYFKPFEKDGKVHGNIKNITSALARAPHKEIVATFIFDDIDPVGVEDSILKLYGLSNRLFKPNTLNLKKIFAKLPNVAWIGDEVYDEGEIDEALFETAYNGRNFAPHMVDKFPLYIHRINGLRMKVRITDQHKVRLGAHLGEGTTLMPGASYINFNAGTEGDSMIEGRVSSGAWIGKGTDVGGGASVLGVLSGGNDRPISAGRNCLLETNSTTGIPIGDAVIVASETAILASSRVRVGIEGHPRYGETVKGLELAGINAVTFRRNDTDGVLEVVRVARNIEFAKKLEDGESILNADLHSHN